MPANRIVCLAALAGSSLAACSAVGEREARDAAKSRAGAPIGVVTATSTGAEGAGGQEPAARKRNVEAATAMRVGITMIKRPRTEANLEGMADRGQTSAGAAPVAETVQVLDDAPDVSAALPPEKKRAVVVGSSSVQGSFGRIIAADLERSGFEVTRRGIVSAGLARPDFRDLREIVDGMPIDQDTAAAFLYVGVNDGQAIWLRPSEREREGARWLPWRDARWADVYLRRARSLFRSICERGAQLALVMLPIEVNKASLERKLQRIRKLQQQAARNTSCAMAVSTAGENGQFVREGRRLRRRDGFHMTPYGARRVWNRVKRRAFHLGDLTRALPARFPLTPQPAEQSPPAAASSIEAARRP